jgi:GNAT superfamily N-acetyltransferase
VGAIPAIYELGPNPADRLDPVEQVIEFEVKPVEAAAVRHLRRAILRPHQEVADLFYPGDDHPSALHVGGFRRGRLVGVASILPDPASPRGAGPSWQLRGMAVEHGHRGFGLGALMLERCLEHAATNGGGPVWCNARIAACGFYERYGFSREGELFSVEGIGLHLRMRLATPSGHGQTRPPLGTGRDADRPGDTSA